METLKQIGVGLCVVVVVCAGMLWVTLGPEVKAEANRAAEARGWQPVFVEQQQVLHDFDGVEFAVPKTQVPGSSLSASFVFRHLIWPGMDALDLYVFGKFYVGGFEFTGVAAPGEYGFNVMSPLGVMGGTTTEWFTIPDDPSGIYYAEIECSWAYSGVTGMRTTVTANPIGEKGVTHSKEQKITDEWFVPKGTTMVATVNGETFTDTSVVDATVPMSIGIMGLNIDADDWYGYTGGAKYVMEIADIQFGGAAIDTSSYEPTTWGGTAPSVNKLWVEGFGGNSIGFWASEDFYNGAYIYNSYGGGVINAPYSYSFNGCKFLWMDGTEVDNSLEVYCTGLRTLSAGGVDIGPWHGSISDLRSKTWTQQHGCYFWDTWDPDMQAEVELYLDLTSAEALGIEVRGPRPAYKIEGAGYGATDTDPGPYDGRYAPVGTHNGETMYSNGYGYLYCTDASGPDWGLGPGPPTDPYYEQTAGGPAGSYLVNTTSYNDDIIDAVTGRRQFSGLLGYGLGPAVTADTGEAISVDSDLATPSFQHDGTFIFDAWPLSATSRNGGQYMTDVCRFEVDANIGIYADAHTHEDWAGTNVSTPTAGGEFTVGAGGGSLALALACNYPARQAAVGAIDAIPVPTAYLTRRHDILFGTGNPVEAHEAVWDWRGRYLTQSFKDLSLPCDLTCRIVYYDDIDGCSDNHKSDSTRQTEYSYSAGDAYTLERTITVTYADGSGWSPVLVDLYDEQNGHPLARVESIEWEFPAAGTYTMTEPQLVLDPGDRQELASGTPGYREAPTNNGAQVKIDESWRYAQGVVSAHVNGYCDAVMCAPDRAKATLIERCMDTLNVLIGAKTGQDMTTCYSLGAWPVANAGEAWDFIHSSGNEAMHMKDSDDAVLKTLAVSDICPVVAEGEQAGEINLDVAVRCYSVTCVRGLHYAFAGTKYVGGRGHGMMAEKSLPNDYPRARNATGGSLQRRHLNSSNPWQTVETDLTSDEHGHWGSAAWEIADTDAARTLWEYAVNADSMGRFATREFALLEIYPVSAVIGNLALTHHFTNAIIVTDVGITTDVGEHKIQHGPGWSSRFAVPASSSTTWANILATRARTELVEDASGTYIRLAHSLDGDWQSPVEIDAAYTHPFGIGVNNRLYISAYSNGQQYLLRHNMNAAHDAISDPITIAASDAVPACLAYILPQYHLLCAVQDASTIKLYQSLDQGQTWALAQSLASLEYPYVFAEPDRVWVVGYASSEVQVASFFSRDEALPAVAAAVSVGQADEGRSAIIRHPSTKELIVVVPKTTDWGLGEPALAIAEYSSLDTGQTWTRKAFHEIT